MSVQNLELLIKLSWDLSPEEKVNLAKHLLSGSQMMVCYKENFPERLQGFLNSYSVFYVPFLLLLLGTVFRIDAKDIGINIDLSYLSTAYVLLICPVLILSKRSRVWVKACAAILLLVYLFRLFS